MTNRAALDLGLVVAAHGRHVVVETPEGQRVHCHPRCKKSDLVVGDRVRWQGDSVITEALAAVGLSGFENRPIGTLSGGQMQRMLFARVLLQDAQGEIRCTGWFRRLVEDGRVLYTGFYTSQVIPSHTGACVKVVFPMPNGNATVILRPEVGEGGALILDSDGAGFGNVGFYRMQRFARGDALTVWKIRSLKERFRVYVDAEGVLRCDHAIRFLGFPVLHLHYRIQRKG